MTVVWCESVYSCLYSAPWVLRQHLSCFVLQRALHVLWCIVTPCCIFILYLSLALFCQLVSPCSPGLYPSDVCQLDSSPRAIQAA